MGIVIVLCIMVYFGHEIHKFNKSKRKIEITDKGDLDKLLWLSSNGNHISFINQLCVIAFKKHGKRYVGTRFIFPSTLSQKNLESICKMKGIAFYEIYTYKNGERKLNLFIKI